MWAATEGGVVEINLPSKSMVTYNPNDGLGGVDVSFVCKIDGKIIGCGYDWASIKEQGKWKKMPIPGEGDVDAWEVDTNLLCARNGNVYELSENHIWKPVGKYSHPPNTRVFLAGDGNKRYVVTSGKLIQLAPGLMAKHFVLPGKVAPLAVCLKDGEINIATDGGLLTRSKGKWALHPLPPGNTGDYIACLSSSEAGILAGTLNGNIYNFTGKTWKKLMSDNSSITFVGGNNEFFYWGTNIGEIYCMNGGVLEEFVEKGQPGDNNIKAIAFYNNRLYAATFENGVYILENEHWGKLNEACSPWIRNMAVYDDLLWLRDADGKLYNYDGNSMKTYILKPSWCSYISVVDDRLLVAGYGGISIFDGAAWEKIYKIGPLKGRVVTSALIDNGSIFMGTGKKGLFHIYDSDGNVHCEPIFIPDTWITCLERVQDKIYVGTFNGGLYSIQESNMPNPARVPVKAEHINCLLADKKDGLWIGSREGLLYINGDETYHLTVSDGLPDNEIQAMLLSDGGIWLATRKGLCFMYY
ncbi:MAG: hypothetical protein M1269_10395 [Chloroflexi bacterium]|nr:hypothetical protein [Chloroflexota bacterium]